MSSTYSTTLRIQLIDTNTEFEAWGQPTDNNLGTIIEQAITGVEAVSLTNLTSYTLTASNAVADQSRNAVLLFTGNLNANCNVIAPSVQKIYVISNQTTNNKAITIKTSSGNGVQLSNGTNQLVYCNGTTFFSAVNANNILGNLAISGNASIRGTKITLGTSVISQNTSNLTFNAPTSNIVSFQLNTGAFTAPYGTTAQRPASPANGMSRWNSTLGWYEIWNGTIWQQITGFIDIDYLIISGGGGGGYIRGGGGGAGGILNGSSTVSITSSYVVIVGSGGGNQASGSASSFNSVSPVGGGFGGSGNGSGGPYYGGNGGSGGGAPSGEGGGLPATMPGGTGTSGQGFAGGANNTGGNGNGGGGGGAGAVGANGPSGIGGAGTTNSLRTGSAVYYAGGGGAGGANDPDNGPQPGSAGGIGGGGTGGYGGVDSGTDGYPGTANTGSGGGGAGGTAGTPRVGGTGGSGIVVIRYISTYVRATGGAITTYSSGGNTYYVHTFTSSGTFATI